MNIEATIVGNLSKDAEMRTSRKDNEYCTANVAVRVEEQKEGAEQPPPLWVSVMCFGRSKDILAQARKGDRIVASGQLKREHWTGRDGTERETWTLFAEHVHGPVPPQRRASTASEQNTPVYEGDVPF